MLEMFRPFDKEEKTPRPNCHRRAGLTTGKFLSVLILSAAEANSVSDDPLEKRWIATLVLVLEMAMSGVSGIAIFFTSTRPLPR